MCRRAIRWPGNARIAAGDIVKYPLIGIDPNDPYGRVMAGIFAKTSLHYDVSIRARFGSTVCALVTQGLGIAIIDEFTLVGGNWPKIRALDIAETDLVSDLHCVPQGCLALHLRHAVCLGLTGPYGDRRRVPRLAATRGGGRGPRARQK